MLFVFLNNVSLSVWMFPQQSRKKIIDQDVLKQLGLILDGFSPQLVWKFVFRNLIWIFGIVLFSEVLKKTDVYTETKYRN